MEEDEEESPGDSAPDQDPFPAAWDDYFVEPGYYDDSITQTTITTTTQTTEEDVKGKLWRLRPGQHGQYQREKLVESLLRTGGSWPMKPGMHGIGKQRGREGNAQLLGLVTPSPPQWSICLKQLGTQLFLTPRDRRSYPAHPTPNSSVLWVMKGYSCLSLHQAKCLWALGLF